jgi:hypothetical protein
MLLHGIGNNQLMVFFPFVFLIGKQGNEKKLCIDMDPYVMLVVEKIEFLTTHQDYHLGLQH